MNRLNFSGHESFYCRLLWLKKGYDYLRSGNKFSQPDGVVHLGVGKNMLSAIQYWMTAFNLIDSRKEVSEFAGYVFGTVGKDPYIEDPATLWLLHYYLIKNNFASIYSLIFNEFRKERVEFTKEHIARFIKIKCAENKTSFNENTVKKDTSVFLRTYLKPKGISSDIEDNFSGLLVESDLVEEIIRTEEKSNWYRIISSERENIPGAVILFAILDNASYGESISFNTLLFDYNSVGNIFAINSNGLTKKIRKLQDRYKSIVYYNDSGVREIQFKEKLDKWAVLDDYYRD
ncbi:MAG: DUF4007 family protein [Candidatus Aminicenantes bacterium]|nr:DUF4007 family protein [Candidatus Aminicenantes bacterium]